MIFVPTIINHTLPQVSVVNNDSGVPSVSYAQIKRSLGNQVYNIEGFYLQATDIRQLIGTIQYNRFDATGNQEFKTIPTTVDPYQSANSILMDLKSYNAFFILNGNSSISTTILPLTTVDVTLYCKRITNSFGMNLNTFKMMEEIFRKPDFFKGYGDIDQIVEDNKKLEESISYTQFEGKKEEEDTTPFAVFASVVFTIGLIYLIKSDV